MDQKYKRIKVIGQGSFGKAYLVRNTEDNVDCVVKQMETAKMEPSDRNAAVKEATILKKMEHPNIIQYQEVFMTRKGRLCIVMEYADGGDIHTVIKSQNNELLDEGRITSWFVQACFALLHVHDLKVLHRDLKTQNIFLTSSGQVKLGDFGIARVLEATKEYAKTMVGTPYYLSPEIIQDRPYRFKSDVWSLGIVLFEMASLQHPFEAENLVNLAAKIVSDEIPKLDDQYSNDLKALVCRMLGKREESRPNVREILQCTFLHKSMHECNAKYSLGLDLSPFEVKRPTADADSAGEGDAETGVGSECGDDVGVFSGESDNEGSSGAGNELERSFANLKFGDTTMIGRVEGLRKYLNQQMSRAEFDQARTLVMEAGEAGTEELQGQVAGVIGAEKAAVLVSIFQLLCFLEQIASHSSAAKAHSSADSNPLKEVIMEKFRKWDVNGDGFISKDELQHVLCTLGLTEAEVVRIFSTADSNRDDKIDYNEFVSWLYSTSCPALDPCEPAVAVKVS
mmetsp:Transcript_70609/g.199338  ORF Transcript_70609/g.199338 Transcript_70609/m.199338 type:complete len:510 (+) Transcript_70609:82-1611(+)